MRRFLILLALVGILASAAQAGPFSDLVWDFMTEHGSLNYAHSLKGGKDKATGIVGALDVNLKTWSIGSQASLTAFGGANMAWTTAPVPGKSDDKDLSLGLGGGLKLQPNNKDYTLRAAIGYNPGPLRWHYEIGITIPL